MCYCYLRHYNILNGASYTGNCTAGYARQEEVGSPDLCAPCPVGSYAPEPRMDDCIPCDKHRSTSREGSTSIQECQCELQPLKVRLHVAIFAGTLYYRPQTTFAKVMFLQVSVCPRGGGARVWLPRERVCVVAGGHAWLPGACVVARGHAWFSGGMHGCWGPCMVARGHAWLLGEAMHDCRGGHAWLPGGCVWLLEGCA